MILKLERFTVTWNNCSEDSTIAAKTRPRRNKLLNFEDALKIFFTVETNKRSRQTRDAVT